MPNAGSESFGLGASANAAPGALAPGVTVVIPFYNEANYIEATLGSLLAQERPPARFLLIDNASTDDSAARARAMLDRHPEIPAEILAESRPGKIFALEAASSRLQTGFVAFCDADTIYPPHYLRTAAAMIEAGGAELVGAMAAGLAADPGSFAGAVARRKTALVGRLLARQCHTGGYGQVFRTSAYLAAGGYDHRRWPYVLEDHEIVHRVLKSGRCAYHKDFWCRPSSRRASRADVSWTTFEQALYHLTPFALKDWFFYSFFAERLDARGMNNARLRAQPWAAGE